ncbi:MAG: acyl-CoA thioesterase [Opitutaceae bacterium]|nr:acyl-CoA thioesterase [Opitutaceae bacterium]
MLTHTTRVNVRYAETDQMGFAYHANYLPWFEVGRTELMKAHGVPYRELEAAGYLLPVLEASLRYLRPARYDDDLEIHARIAERPGIRCRIDYEVRRGGELLATGHTLHCFIDRAGRPVRPPPGFVEKMRACFP